MAEGSKENITKLRQQYEGDFEEMSETLDQYKWCLGRVGR